MYKSQRIMFFVSFAILLSLVVSGCGSAQTPAPTIAPSSTSTTVPTETPSPTPTLTPTITPTATPTPIPGIGAPILSNGESLQILDGRVGAEPPSGFRLRSGYDTTLILAVKLSGAAAAGTSLIQFEKTAVIDENGRESTISAGQLIFPTDGGGATISHVLIFEVSKEAKVFSLRIADGQVIDLMPVLMFDPPTVVDGSVTFDGNPLANATVELVLRNKAVLTTQTDAGGKFQFADVPPDDYNLVVTLEGEEKICKVENLAAEVRSGWTYSHDFKVDSRIFSMDETELFSAFGEFTLCDAK